MPEYMNPELQTLPSWELELFYDFRDIAQMIGMRPERDSALSFGNSGVFNENVKQTDCRGLTLMHAAVPPSLREHDIDVIELNYFTDRSEMNTAETVILTLEQKNDRKVAWRLKRQPDNQVELYTLVDFPDADKLEYISGLPENVRWQILWAIASNDTSHLTRSDRSGDFARRVYLGFLKGSTATKGINQDDRLVLDVLATELYHARHFRGTVSSEQPIAMR